MNLTEQLTEIVTETAALLGESTAIATDDPARAASVVTAGGTAVLILASPALEWTGWEHVTATWTAWVIVGATTDPTAAAGYISPVLATLAGPLGLDSARPQTYELAGRTWPGYELSFTTHTL